MTDSKNNNYALYETFDEISHRCIEYLMDHDEVIWKLLKYNDADAWNKTNLTLAEKRSLIYNGSDDTSAFRVFMDDGQPDVNTQEMCQIRIMPYQLQSPNRVIGDLQVLMSVYTHYKINHLSNYRVRTDMIMKRFLQVFNGATIDGVGMGALHLDTGGTYGTRLEAGGQAPFRGKWLILGVKSN